MRILTNLDLAKNELQNAQIQNLATAPANPVTGQIYYNSTDKTFYGWNGSEWVDLGQVLTGADIVTLVNGSASLIDDNNLSAAANDAITKRHSHANKAKLDAIEEAYTTAEKNKLGGIAAGANNYSHPTGDGNLHVPATGTTNNGKLLKASATAGSLSWGTLAAADIPKLALDKISDAGTAASKNVGTAEGNVPILGASGKLDTAVLPALAISDTFVVASQAAMLALTAETGDIAIRTDLNKSFVLKAEPASTLANWQELLTPTDAVLSVNGKTGAVTLTKSDVGLGNVDNTKQATKAEFDAHVADTVKHITSTERTAWSAKTGKYAVAIGDGSSTQFTVTHNLGSMDVVVMIRESATPYSAVYADVQIIDANSLRVLFGAAPASGQYRVVVVG